MYIMYPICFFAIVGGMWMLMFGVGGPDRTGT
jgi:hypothetical protein